MQPVSHSIATHKTVQPLSLPVYLSSACVLTLVGFGASIYLAISHHRVHTDPGYRSFCAISNALNCDTVSQSPFAVVWGLPVALWGAIGYAGLFMVFACAGIKAARPQRMWALAYSIALCFSLMSLVLAGVSTYKIGSYCIVCILTYAVNLLLLFLTWIVRRRYACGAIIPGIKNDLGFLLGRPSVSFGILLALCCAVAGAYRWIPAYWELKSHPAVGKTAHGRTDDGAPWIGAADPLVTIVEFADYQCFQCRKMHFYLRELVFKYPDSIRIVHRHYPMDHEVNFIVHEPFHIGSGRMAVLAIHAETVGKFWPMNDVLYALAARGGDMDLREIADKTQIDARELAAALDHFPYRSRLQIDIRIGMKHRILGTPSYLVGGRIHQGHISADVMADILQRLENR